MATDRHPQHSAASYFMGGGAAQRHEYFGDVGASVGVIVGGLIILLTRWYPADPLISLFIALLIARGAWDILRQTVDILMEATPRDVNLAQLVRDLVRTPGVADVHDLHVWAIAGGMTALSAHVQLADDRPLSACDPLRGELDRLLARRYKIAHTTLQLEYACGETHADRDLYCGMDMDEDGAAAAHDHTDAPDHGHEPAADGIDPHAGPG